MNKTQIIKENEIQLENGIYTYYTPQDMICYARNLISPTVNGEAMTDEEKKEYGHIMNEYIQLNEMYEYTQISYKEYLQEKEGIRAKFDKFIDYAFVYNLREGVIENNGRKISVLRKKEVELTHH